ncbi:MAG: acyltransferase family protein [Bacteroidota bacterium]
MNTSTDSGFLSDPKPEQKLSGRLLSLDVFRGITIAGMILVNNPGSWEYVYPALKHAEWNGWTPTDLIFPFFLFIVGVAITYSFANRLAKGISRKKLFLQVIRRTLILFALGLFLNGFPYYNLATIRIMGVLQRIALAYFFSSVIYLVFKTRAQVIITVLLLLIYWALMKLVPVPGYGAGILAKEGNLAQYIDNLILKGHMWTPTWDPEGFLSTIPAITTTLLGVFTGQFLRSNREPLQKTSTLFLLGNVALVIGVIWDMWFPINKNLWTSSYVIFTGGMALLFLATCYYLIDVKKSTWWTKPFVIYGTNAITVYVLSGILARILILVKIPQAEGTSVLLKTFIYQNYFASWAGPTNGSLFFALAYIILWLGIMTIFYKKAIFIKI